MKGISKTVWLLSLVSLFTDMASEMLYPIMPIYLKSIGFSIVAIGVLEGFAEAIAGLSKGYFGRLSDNTGKRVSFVQLGYSFSAFSKPLMALFIFPLWVFFARTIDRLGKGIRTGARDAMLSDEATPQTKGRIFGFHRSMDTLGAVLGPSLALIYLYYYPKDYKTLFLIAFLPGLLAVFSAMFLSDKPFEKKGAVPQITLNSFFDFWRQSPRIYRRVVTGFLIFALFNSSDVFLLLMVKQSGLGDMEVVRFYIFYNLVYAIFAYPIGILADKIGIRAIFIVGLVLFSFVYFGMALVAVSHYYFLLFFVYGLFAASNEGISKAWISQMIEKKEMATAIGTYTALQSICAMIASALAGLVWFWFGPKFAFLLTGFMTVIVIVYFSILPNPKAYVSENQ